MRNPASVAILPPLGARRPMVAHVPHAATSIPDEFRVDLLIDDEALARELVRMTDWHTDRLFDGVRELGATLFVNQLSRLVVDPERFGRDDDEPAATYGQGAVYTRASDGEQLRHQDPARRQELIDRVYVPYHAALTELVAAILDEFGECLILDCHSFSSVPLHSEPDQRADRPDICIGTDAFHTSAVLIQRLAAAFAAENFQTEVDRPFSGALVPVRWYRRDPRVTAVMVEVRRGLYCDEASGAPLHAFDEVGRAVVRAVGAALGQD